MSRSRGAECVVFGRGNTLLREKHGFLRREKRPCGRNAPAGHFLKKVPRPLKNFMGISLARAYAPLPCKEAGCLRRGDHRSPALPPTYHRLRKPLPVGATIGRPRCLRHTTASENLCRRPRSPAVSVGSAICYLPYPGDQWSPLPIASAAQLLHPSKALAGALSRSSPPYRL